MKMTDQRLALNVKMGDKNAFRELFERYSSQIRRFAFSYLKNNDDANELVQNTFLKIWEKRDLIDTSKNIKAFIFTITVNIIYDFIRRKNIEVAFQDYTSSNHHSEDNNTWNFVIFNEMKQNIHDLVNKLPKQQQIVFNLSKMEELSNDEIAVMTGLSKRTVENHLYRAVSFLKQNIEIN